MSHQGVEGWYPECEICKMGNLSKVVCKDCYNKKIKELEEEQHKFRFQGGNDKI